MKLLTISLLCFFFILSFDLLAGSKKSTQKNTPNANSQLKTCQNQKKSCEKSSQSRQSQINRLSASVSALMKDNKSYQVELSKAKSENTGLKAKVKELEEKASSQKANSPHALLYCKCDSSDPNGSVQNCNKEEYWLCHSDGKPHGRRFLYPEIDWAQGCISQNAQSYIANHGYWLKNKIKTKAPSEVAFWDDCRRKCFFSHLRSQKWLERDCQN